MKQSVNNDGVSSEPYPASWAYLFVTNEQSDDFGSNYNFYDSSGNTKSLTSLTEFGTSISNSIANRAVTGNGPIIIISDSRLYTPITVAIGNSLIQNLSGNWTTEFDNTIYDNTTHPEIFDSDATWRSHGRVALEPAWINSIADAVNRWPSIIRDPYELTTWNGTQEDSSGTYFYTTDFQLSWKPVLAMIRAADNNITGQAIIHLIVTEYGAETLFRESSLYGLTGNSFNTIPDASGTSLSSLKDCINNDADGNLVEDRGIFITFTDSNGGEQSVLVRRCDFGTSNSWSPNFIDLGQRLDYYYSSVSNNIAARTHFISLLLVDTDTDNINYDDTTTPPGMPYWWTSNFTFSFQFIRFSDSQSRQDDVANTTHVTWSLNIVSNEKSYYKDEGEVEGIWIQFNEYKKSNYTNGKEYYKTKDKFLNIYTNVDNDNNFPNEVVVLGSNNAIDFVTSNIYPDQGHVSAAQKLFEGAVTNIESIYIPTAGDRRGYQIDMTSSETYDYYRIIFRGGA